MALNNSTKQNNVLTTKGQPCLIFSRAEVVFKTFHVLCYEHHRSIKFLVLRSKQGPSLLENFGETNFVCCLRFDAVTKLTQPHYNLCVKLAKLEEANNGNDIF